MIPPTLHPDPVEPGALCADSCALCGVLHPKRPLGRCEFAAQDLYSPEPAPLPPSSPEPTEDDQPGWPFSVDLPTSCDVCGAAAQECCKSWCTTTVVR